MGHRAHLWAPTECPDSAPPCLHLGLGGRGGNRSKGFWPWHWGKTGRCGTPTRLPYIGSSWTEVTADWTRRWPGRGGGPSRAATPAHPGSPRLAEAWLWPRAGTEAGPRRSLSLDLPRTGEYRSPSAEAAKEGAGSLVRLWAGREKKRKRTCRGPEAGTKGP